MGYCPFNVLPKTQHLFKAGVPHHAANMRGMDARWVILKVWGGGIVIVDVSPITSSDRHSILP